MDKFVFLFLSFLLVVSSDAFAGKNSQQGSGDGGDQESQSSVSRKLNQAPSEPEIDPLLQHLIASRRAGAPNPYPAGIEHLSDYLRGGNPRPVGTLPLTRGRTFWIPETSDSQSQLSAFNGSQSQTHSECPPTLPYE
jgi:hypothetical protein